MLSDSLIALGAFRDWSGRGLSIAIMATYAIAQAMLVIAIQRFRHTRLL
ncbi:MAG: lysoplasmalogenase family protein [Dermatophilaceae bacterium]